MKWLLLTALLALNVQAESGFYYDKSRSGEGITIAETADGGVAWVLFTYVDKSVSVPPVVSPPKPSFTIESCNSATLWLTGQSVLLANGFAIGEVYINVTDDYPFATDDSVSEAIQIGTFLIERVDEGFELTIDSNGSLAALSIFDRTFKFISPLAR